MDNYTKKASLNHHGFSKNFVDGLLALFLLFFSAELFAFTFTSTGAATTAPNCTGTYGGVYKCTNGLNNGGNFTTINNSAGPVTIYITGNMAINESIDVSSDAYPVTFYVDGSLSVAGYGVALNLPSTATNVTFYVRDNVTTTSSSIRASIYTTGNGNIAIGNTGTGPYIDGNIATYNGTIRVYGRVEGCVKSNRGNAGDILLGNNAAFVDGVNCASNGTKSCVTNSSANPMPSYCNEGTLIAQYNLDESTWNGTTNETKDSARITAGPFDGQGVGTPNPTAQGSNPARFGATGTCGAASFTGSSNGSGFTLDNLPVRTTAGAKTSVSFWMLWDGASTVKIPIGWSKYNLAFSSTSFGFDTWNGDRFGISNAGLGGGWHHVVAVFTNGNVTSNELYIDGTKRTLTQQEATPNNTNAVVQSTLKVGGLTFDNSYGFDGGRIDEVKVYNGAVTQAQVTADFNATHYCHQFLPAVDNLAPSATLATSFVSSWEHLEGVNDNVATTSSYVYHFNSGGAKVYGNWNGAGAFGATNWVSFEWPTAKRLTEFQVLWWNDTFFGGETLSPTTAYVEYWNGSAWVNLGNIGTTLHTFNSLLINNIITNKIRVAMSSAKSTGIIEVRIFGSDAAPIVYYPFDELSWNGTTANPQDSSGNNYHGQATGSSTLPNTAQSNRAIANSPGTCGYGDFTGGAKAVLLPANFPKLKDNLTITAWVRLNNFNTSVVRVFVDGESITTNGGYALSINSRKVSFYKNAAVGTNYINLIGNTLLNANQWYFVAASMNDATDSTTLYIYDQSGALVESLVGTGYTNTYTGAAVASNISASIGALKNFSNSIDGQIDEVRVYSGALTQTEINTIRTTTHLCPAYVTNVNAGSFNCIATQETNVDAGKLYTQLANTSFNIKVIALKNTVPRVAETSFSAASDRTAVLRFKDQISNSLINFSGGETANSKNVLFTTANTTGIVQVTGITIPQAYKNLKCEISEASVATPSASSDNFSVRPQSLTLSSNVTNPSIAGNNFTLTATGGTGYNGAPKLLVSNMSAMQSNMLTNTANSSVSDSANNTFTAGSSAATLSLRYHDVGSISFNAGAVLDDSFTAIDNPTDCIAGSTSNTAASGKYGCHIASTALAAVGRFKPDHFTATTNTLSAGCISGGFTYMSQSNLTLNTVIEAQSAQNIAAKSYNTGTLSYTVRNSATNITGTPSRLQKSGITWAPTSSWSNGALTLNESTLSYARSSIGPDGPYENFNINYAITDTLGDSIPFSGNAYTNDTKMRYGRLSIQNSYGSELLPLTVPIEAQYWNGSSYQRNQLDTCTSISPVNITMGNYKNNLAACETQLSVASSANTTTMVGGKITAKLTKPGAGNNGSVDLTVNTNTASGTTCIPTTATATSANDPWFGATNPSARATFGLYKSPVIYMRENF